MNWIEVTDPKQLPYDCKRILAQNEYGDIGVVYWSSYNWVYELPYQDCDEVDMPGKIVKYVNLEK